MTRSFALPYSNLVNPISRLREFVSYPSHGRTWALLGFLILVLAIPLTVNIAQKQQELRQRAENTCSSNDECTGWTYTSCTTSDGQVGYHPICATHNIPDECYPGSADAQNAKVAQCANRLTEAECTSEGGACINQACGGESKGKCTDGRNCCKVETSTPTNPDQQCVSKGGSCSYTDSDCAKDGLFVGFTCNNGNPCCNISGTGSKRGPTDPTPPPGTQCLIPSVGQDKGCVPYNGPNNCEPPATAWKCSATSTTSQCHSQGGRCEFSDLCRSDETEAFGVLCPTSGQICCKKSTVAACPNPGYIPNTTNNNEDWGGECSPGDGKAFNTGDPTTCTVAGCDFYPKANRYCWHNTGKEYADPAGCAKYGIPVQPRGGTPRSPGATTGPGGTSAPSAPTADPNAISCSAGLVGTCNTQYKETQLPDGKWLCVNKDDSSKTLKPYCAVAVKDISCANPVCTQTGTEAKKLVSALGTGGWICANISTGDILRDVFPTCQTAGATPPASAAPGTTVLVFTIKLDGLGTAGDVKNPTSARENRPNKARTASVEIINTSTNAGTAGNVNLTYSGGAFTGTVNLGNLTGSSFNMKVKVPGYIKRDFQKKFGKTFALAAGTNTLSDILSLPTGDVNRRNQVSALDFETFRACYGQTPLVGSCINADLDDTGKVDLFDFNLWLREIGQSDDQ